MTGAAGTLPAGEAVVEARPSLLGRLRPAEGWSTVAILLFMLLTIAWAVDDAGWAGVGVDGKTATGFLPVAIALGTLWGIIGSKSRLGVTQVHMIGALLAVAYLLPTVAGVISAERAVDDRIGALVDSFGRFYHDLVVTGIRSAEVSPFLVSIGAIAWATGQFAAVNLFRRRRALGVILFAGLVMLVEVSATIKPQYLYLLLFAGSALALLIRTNLLEQQQGWLERGIGDRDGLGQLFLRSGAIFLLVTLTGSVLLAGTASSAPLAGFWRNVDDDLVRVGSELNRIVGGVTGAARGPSGLFTSTQTIRGVWEASNAVAFRWTASDGQPHYWRGATYDDFDGTTWQQLERSDPVRIEPGAALLEGTVEPLAEQIPRETVELGLTALDYGSEVVLAPDSPVLLDRPADRYTNGPGGPFALIELAEPLSENESYQLTARIPVEREEEGGVTANELAAAGIVYPAWAERYVAVRPGSIGPATYELSNAIVEGLAAEQRDPYHVAEAVQRYLYRDGRFRYRTDVRGLCGAEKLVDCFLRTKVGYCEYFATAMVMLLRAQQIPSRLAMGYLPGRPIEDGAWEVDRSAAHAWVEVYFPSYGWVRFDPTPGNTENGQTPTRLPAGIPVATPPPADPSGPRPTPRFRNIGEELASEAAGRTPAAGPVAGSGTPGAPIEAVMTTVLVVLALAALGLVLLGRSGRGRPAPEPDLVYRGVAKLAGRFGHGPRPTQTAYEYAGTLGALVPAVRTELQVVARAKVESTYARRALDGDLLESLRAAYRRLRVGLLRLALRRRPGGARRVGAVFVRRGRR